MPRLYDFVASKATDAPSGFTAEEADTVSDSDTAEVVATGALLAANAFASVDGFREVAVISRLLKSQFFWQVISATADQTSYNMQNCLNRQDNPQEALEDLDGARYVL